MIQMRVIIIWLRMRMEAFEEKYWGSRREPHDIVTICTNKKKPKILSFDNNDLGLLEFGKALYDDFLCVLGKTNGRVRVSEAEFYEDKVVQERFIAVQKEERLKRMESKNENSLDDNSSTESFSSSLPLSALSKSFFYNWMSYFKTFLQLLYFYFRNNVKT